MKKTEKTDKNGWEKRVREKAPFDNFHRQSWRQRKKNSQNEKQKNNEKKHEKGSRKKLLLTISKVNFEGKGWKIAKTEKKTTKKKNEKGSKNSSFW